MDDWAEWMMRGYALGTVTTVLLALYIFRRSGKEQCGALSRIARDELPGEDE